MTDKQFLKEVGIITACEQCGNKNDFMIVFAKYPICAKCVRKNHKKVIKQ